MSSNQTRVRRRPVYSLHVLSLLLVALAAGCGTADDTRLSLNPPEVAPAAKMMQVGPPPVTRQEIEAVAEESQTKLLELVPRALLLQASNLRPFRATTSYGRPGTGFYFQYSDTDPSHYANFAEEYGPTVFLPSHILPWPAKVLTADAVSPAVKASGYVSNGSTLQLSLSSLFDPEIATSLQSLTNQDSFSLSGLEPPLAPDVMMLTNESYVSVADGVNGRVHRSFSGRATLPSGRQAYFSRYFYIYQSLLDYELAGNVLFILPPPPRMISIANITSAPGANTTLDFDISTTNSTLNRWSVDLQQNNTTIKSFSPSVDLRGPGTSSGFNPVHVSLPWDGRDSNNNRVVGNYTWVASANTTNFVNGGGVNDGIDSVQARLDGTAMNGTLLASVKQISSSSIELLDVNNEKIKMPQYDVDLQKKDPIALPIRDAFPVLNVTLSASLPPDGEPQAYFFWGETASSEIIFGPAQHTPINGPNRVTFPVKVTQIAKHSVIHWYYAPKSGGTIGSMGTTDSPIYVTLDTPREPQQRPRIDVVDFAVRQADQDQDELPVLQHLTEGIYYQNGFKYRDDTEAQHTIDTPFGQEFRASTIIKFPGNPDFEPEGSCQDFSNLFQVCGAALGVKGIAIRTIIGGKKVGLHILPVLPIGLARWLEQDPEDEDDYLSFHQAGWYFGNTSPDAGIGTFYDPTYKMNKPQPELPVNFDPERYKRLLFDPNRAGLYSPQLPDIPVEVY